MLKGDALAQCLQHLEQAERIMDQAHDLSGLTRISFVIDLIRRQCGLPDRSVHDIFIAIDGKGDG